MDVEAFIALMRLTESNDKVVAKLAKMALGLAEGIREAEARAALAEAALEAERAKVADLLSSSDASSGSGENARSLRPRKSRVLVEAAT